MTPSSQLTSVACALLFTATAHGQWASFSNQTNARMVINLPDLPGDAIQLNNDVQEKDYAWGDVDNDGDVDLLVVRKIPFSHPGGKRKILFLNENGVLVDRTATLAIDATGVPAEQGISQGFLDPTNDRQAVLVDVNNDGWLDFVTATTVGDVNDNGTPNMLPRYLGHPRIYMNKSEVAGVWQGLRYEYDRFPQLFSKTGIATNPRFGSVAAGDINKDGYVDLYFSDSDTTEVGPAEPLAHDVDNKLFMNQGSGNAGFFTDESLARMGSSYSYPGNGTHNLLWSNTGTHGLISDMNGDGVKDVLKLNTLVGYIHLAVMTNSGAGFFNTTSYKPVYTISAYSASTADLNGDGRLDLVMSDDGNDRYLINQGNDGNNAPNFSQFSLTSALDGDFAFSSQSTVADLDNDGLPEAIVADIAFANTGCNRRTHIYHNNLALAPPNNLLRELSPSVIPTGSLIGVYIVGAFDINNDGWKDIILGKCGGTEVWMNNQGSLQFSYPNGRPSTLAPNRRATIHVQLNGVNGGIVLDNSAKIFTSLNGGPFTESGMSSLGSGLYQANIPSNPCSTNVRYYFSAQVTTGQTFTDPPLPPGATVPATFHSAVAALSTHNLLSESFEGAATGWIVQNDGSLTGGAWELANPIGTWNEGVKAAPRADHTPNAGVNCFVTQNGTAGGALHDADVDGGATHLISPVFNLSNRNARISFARWFYSSTRGDVLQVSVSNDNGANWTTVFNYTALPQPNFTGSAEVNKTQWIKESFVVGDYVTPTSQVRVRFTANDVAPAGVVEAAMDDFVADRIDCNAPCPADITGNHTVNVDDLLAIINAWGPCPAPCSTDIAPIGGNGFVNVDDLLTVIQAWGPCP